MNHEYVVSWSGRSWRDVPAPVLPVLPVYVALPALHYGDLTATVYRAFHGQMASSRHIAERINLPWKTVQRGVTRLLRQRRVERMRGPGRGWGRESWCAHYRPVTGC